MVGICLGSQLIGEALGAKVCQSPEKEIGHYPIALTEAGQQHPLFSHFGSPLTVGHWHNDMPWLTDQRPFLPQARAVHDKSYNTVILFMVFSAIWSLRLMQLKG